MPRPIKPGQRKKATTNVQNMRIRSYNAKISRMSNQPGVRPAGPTRVGGSSGPSIDLKFDPWSIGNALKKATGKRR